MEKKIPYIMLEDRGEFLEKARKTDLKTYGFSEKTRVRLEAYLDGAVYSYSEVIAENVDKSKETVNIEFLGQSLELISTPPEGMSVEEAVQRNQEMLGQVIEDAISGIEKGWVVGSIIELEKEPKEPEQEEEEKPEEMKSDFEEIEEIQEELENLEEPQTEEETMEEQKLIKTLESIKGMTKNRLQAVQEAGFSVKKLRESSEEELQEVKGIGEKLARKIKERVGED